MPLSKGAVQPPVFLPLHSMRKLLRAREALLPPPMETMMASVPPLAAETELLVIATTFVASPGMPAVAPGPLALELRFATLMPTPPLLEMLFWLMVALVRLKDVVLPSPRRLMP